MCYVLKYVKCLNMLSDFSCFFSKLLSFLVILMLINENPLLSFDVVFPVYGIVKLNITTCYFQKQIQTISLFFYAESQKMK